jgi:hypothetical protein
MLMIKIPNKGNLSTLNELISEIPIIVKVYAISITLKFLVLNLRIEKTANRPNAKVISRKTVPSIEHIKKTIIPIRKKVNKNFGFLEYLK